MKTPTLVMVLAGAAVVLASPRPAVLDAQPPPPGSPNAVAAGLARRIPTLLADAAVPGIQVGLVEDGKVTWTGAFGVADATAATPVTSASVFEAASLSKPVFAYAVLKLADAGRLDLDAPLVSYLPGPYSVGDDERLRQVTARHVLSHRAGFPNWRTEGKPLTMHFAPGERFSYSGEGYVYLAAVVERVTGETLEAFVKRTVFNPLGMASSSYVWQARYEGLEVHNHDALGRPAGRGRPWRPNAAASLHTTAGDYARFVAAVVTGQGLKASTARDLATPQSRVDEGGPNTVSTRPTGRSAAALAWGLGWGLARDGDGWLLWHWGDNGPTKAFVVASPTRRGGMVMFANSQNGLSIVAALFDGTWAPALAPALTWLDVDPYAPAWGRFVRTLSSAGAASALREYTAHRQDDPGERSIDEDAMNRAGYTLLRGGRLKDAIAVFRQNVDDHPGSWNAHDSLGEALAADGDKAGATRSYERSLELNPENTGAKEALKKLSGKRP